MRIFALAFLPTLASILLLVLPQAAAAASPPAEYVERVQSRYRSEAKRYDVDADGRLTQGEVQGSNLLAPWFDTMDTNRDGIVSTEELERFLANLPPAAQ